MPNPRWSSRLCLLTLLKWSRILVRNSWFCLTLSGPIRRTCFVNFLICVIVWSRNSQTTALCFSISVIGLNAWSAWLRLLLYTVHSLVNDKKTSTVNTCIIIQIYQNICDVSLRMSETETEEVSGEWPTTEKGCQPVTEVRKPVHAGFCKKNWLQKADG